MERFEVLSSEDRERLHHELRDLEKMVGYRQPIAPELQADVAELDRKYIRKRDELLHLFEEGKMTPEAFCHRFRTEAAPIFQQSHELYRTLIAIHNFIYDGI